MAFHATILAMNKVPAKAAAKIVDDQRLGRLIRLVAQNLDKNAFSELYDVLAPRLKASLMKSGHDAVVAEDIVQDALVNVWTKAGLFDETRGSAVSWVYSIARNVGIDRVRRNKRLTPLDLEVWDPIDESSDSEELMAQAQDVLAVREALKTVPEEQRTVIDLAFLHNLTQADIAQRLSLPLGTVKSRMRLAYGHMRKKLEQLK